MRGYLHDFEKIILYCFFEKAIVHNIHVNRSRHHKKAKTKNDYKRKVIDWECAKDTKPDKQLNAKDTLYKFYPEMEDKILPILKEFKLI